MSKKDFQNGFALGFASGGVLEIEKEEQEKTVDITENGTTEVTPDEGMALNKVTINVEVESGGGESLPDWEDDSPIVASGKAYSGRNTHWEVTEKGTFRWVIDYVSEDRLDNKGLFANGSTISTIMQVCPKIVPFLSKIRQAYAPDGIVDLEIHNMVNCERVRFPNSLTKKPAIGVLPRVKELDMSADIWATLSDYQCNAFYSLEKVILSPLTNALPTRAFAQCYSLKEINIENVTTFKNSCFLEDYNLTQPIVFNAGLVTIEQQAFNRAGLTSVTFRNALDNLPTIANNAFAQCYFLTDIYVPWAEGAVANAPWGAPNATIHYNTTYDENGNPIVTEE
jgi:hypothetical protein